MSRPVLEIRVWRAAALLALSTGTGLAAGLLGDGAWDAVGWCAVGLPLVVALRCLLPGKGGRAAAIPSRSPAGRL